MPRPTRIHLVTGLAICLGGLLIAFVGPAIVVTVVGFQSGPRMDIDIMDQMLAQMQVLNRAATINQTLFLVGAGLAAGALLYSLVVLAAWFIGPRAKE